MADLDDFFAKKDRKKSKGKKFMTTDEVAKKLEETEKKSEKIKKDKPLIQNPITLQEGGDMSEDEWKNFEEEKKDYSGLKIQNLTLEDSSDSENNDGESDRILGEYASDEMTPKKGPWKVIEVDQTSKENSTGKGDGGSNGGNTNTTTNASKSYIPPYMRNQNSTIRDRASRTKPGAPDINNKEYFPTLNAAKNETPTWNKRKQEGAGVNVGGGAGGGFEEVRNSRSHSNRSDPSQRHHSLQIGNKFGALESEHS